MKVGIIGAGTIGSYLYKKVREKNWEVAFILRKESIYKTPTEKVDSLSNLGNYVNMVDLVFCAIPTLDDGTLAYNYLKVFLEKKIPVVTCEKGALSNYFTELEPSLLKIGYSATVGGGTQLLPKVRKWCSGEKEAEMYGVVNGTLNYIFDRLSKGGEVDSVVEDAIRKGFVEPGAKDALAVINTEATKDVPMKTAILFNIANISFVRLRAKDIAVRKITTSDFSILLTNPKDYRYVISITKGRKNLARITCFTHEIDGWTLSGGFVAIKSNPIFKELLLSGVGNGVLVHMGGKEYSIFGEGAGAEPTTRAMIKDAEYLSNNGS